jgi:hypothetical protein
MFKNFTENIEEMVVDNVPIVKSLASRADYQTSQTTWKKPSICAASNLQIQPLFTL